MTGFTPLQVIALLLLAAFALFVELALRPDKPPTGSGVDKPERTA